MIALFFLCLLLPKPSHTLAVSTSHSFFLEPKQLQSLGIRPAHQTRLTVICYWGRPSLRVVIDRQGESKHVEGLLQVLLERDTIGKDVEVILQGPGVGIIRQMPVEKFELLRHGEEAVMNIRGGQSRVFEVHPKIRDKLIVQRLRGRFTFRVGKCKRQQKIDCYNRLQRTQPLIIHNNWQSITLEPCSDCLLLLQIHAQQDSHLRMSINSSVSVLAHRPAFSGVRREQSAQFIVYGPPLSKGKIIGYSGAFTVKTNTSQVLLSTFENGFEFILSKKHNITTPVAITIVGEADSSYISVEGPSEGNTLRLVDGLPTTMRLEPHTNYTIQFHSFSSGNGNFHLSGSSALLGSLLIRFANIQTGLNYTIRPKYIFNSAVASQSFQLGNSKSDVVITLIASFDEPGYLNVSANSQERLLLPLNWPHSAILEHHESHFYSVRGSTEVELIVRKCVECHLEAKIWSEGGQSSTQTVLQREFRVIVKSPEGQLFIDITTNHYAFYTIIIRLKQSSTSIPQPILKNKIIRAYLTEPDNDLEIEFDPPFCGSRPCHKAKYTLIEGSDSRHIASRAYCPNTLFDFDERTKDISVETVSPESKGTGPLSLVRPLRHRDWLVIATQVQGVVMSYDLLNVGEMREYSGIRWPLFYLLMFLTLAVFLSIVVLIGLRKKSSNGGYIRASSQCSAQALP